MAGRWAELLELQRAGADVVQQCFKANPSDGALALAEQRKQDGGNEVLGRAGGWGRSELSAWLLGQSQEGGITPVHGKLTKPITR